MKYTVITATALGSKDEDCFWIPTHVLETLPRDLTGVLFLLMVGSRREDFNWEWIRERTYCQSHKYLSQKKLIRIRAELIELDFLREFEIKNEERTERLVFLGCPIIAVEMEDTIDQLKQDGWEVAEVTDEI